jgi:hypothetical protein
VEFLVGDEKLLKIQGGEKKEENFHKLSISDSVEPDLCHAFLNHGAQ